MAVHLEDDGSCCVGISHIGSIALKELHLVPIREFIKKLSAFWIVIILMFQVMRGSPVIGRLVGVEVVRVDVVDHQVGLRTQLWGLSYLSLT